MNKINFLLMSVLIIATTLVSSCKKEVRIEKNLWKKGGEWNIESLVAKQTSTYAPDNFEETYSNYGTFTFKEDGTGNYTITVNGDFYAGALTHTNTEDKLTLSIDNEVRVFDIVEWEKNKMKITNTENFSSSLGSGTTTETYTLVKK